MPRQLTFELGIDPSFHEADFICDPSNQVAYEHIVASDRWAGPLTLLEGPQDAGKSHLASIFQERTGAIWANPETLDELTRDEQTAPVVVEEIDQPKFYDESELFHLLNQSMRSGRLVLMTARSSVANWPYATDDVKSRARLATFVSLSAPSDTLLSQLLAKHLSDRQLKIDGRTLNYLVSRMERSATEAAVIAEQLDTISLERAKPISMKIAADVLDQRQERLSSGSDTSESESDSNKVE